MGIAVAVRNKKSDKELAMKQEEALGTHGTHGSQSLEYAYM